MLEKTCQPQTGIRKAMAGAIALIFCAEQFLFDASAIESTANALGSVVHLLEFVVREMYFEGTHDTICANHARNGESDVIDAIFAIEDSGARQNRVLIVENGLDEAAGSHRDTRVREALAVDDIVSNLYELLLNSLLVEFLRLVEVLIHVVDGEASAARRGPSNKSSVAVLTEDVAVDVLRIHLVLVSQDTAETIRLEHRARAEDEVARIIELRGNNVRSDIERVRDHDDHGLFRALDDLAEYGLHDFGVRASELQAIRRLTRADGRAGCDDDDVRIFAVIVVTEVELDVRAVNAARCMAGVNSLAPGFVLVEVDKSDFRCELEVCNLVRYSRTNVAGADDDDFSSVVHCFENPL